MNTLLYQKPGKLPIIYVAPAGTISILLNKGITVEVSNLKLKKKPARNKEAKINSFITKLLFLRIHHLYIKTF